MQARVSMTMDSSKSEVSSTRADSHRGVPVTLAAAGVSVIALRECYHAGRGAPLPYKSSPSPGSSPGNGRESFSLTPARAPRR